MRPKRRNNAVGKRDIGLARVNRHRPGIVQRSVEFIPFSGEQCILDGSVGFESDVY